LGGGDRLSLPECYSIEQYNRIYDHFMMQWRGCTSGPWTHANQSLDARQAKKKREENKVNLPSNRWRISAPID
jgi:hypothetical protein